MTHRRRNLQVRRLAGTVCLLALTVGAIVAPASHYAFMMASSAYGHFEGPGQADAHGGHTMQAHAPADHGAAVSAPATAHAPCQYADLFASFTSDLVGPAQFVVTVGASPVPAFSDERPAVSDFPFDRLARGPPSVQTTFLT